MLTCNASTRLKKKRRKEVNEARARAAELAIANCGSARTASTDRRGRMLTGRGGREREKRREGEGGGSRAEKRQRQNATNSKRAESCACIRNTIEPLSTGTGPLLSTRGGERAGGGVRALNPARAAGKF